METVVVDPDDERARVAVGEYVAELDRRFPGGFDVGTAAPAPLDLVVLAVRGDETLGCGGLIVRAGGVAELKRMWVAPAARGLGVGRLLLRGLEDAAAGRGCTSVRLDTNEVLVEAIRLYETSGYQAVPRFNDDPYPTHFFAKDLTPGPTDPV